MDRLSNTVRPYAWGSTTAIPALLGIAPTGEPQAEMWMGAHPGAPSLITRTAPAPAPGTAPDSTPGSTPGPTPAAPVEQPLTDVIAADPARELGPATVEKFGPHLPFLLKLLAAGARSPSRSTRISPRRSRGTRTRSAGPSRSTPRTARTRTPTTSPS